MRLIDADITIKDLLKEAAHQATINHPENARGLISAVEHIKEQPTAYDVDGTIELMESLKANNEDAGREIDKFIRNQHIDICISIVKGAVKDEYMSNNNHNSLSANSNN